METKEFEVLLTTEMEDVKGGLASADCNCISGAGQNINIGEMDGEGVY